MPINVSGLAPYPDFLALGFAVLVTCKFVFLRALKKRIKIINKFFT